MNLVVEILQKGLHKLGDVDNHAADYIAFTSSFRLGYLHVAKWLYSLGRFENCP